MGIGRKKAGSEAGGGGRERSGKGLRPPTCSRPTPTWRPVRSQGLGRPASSIRPNPSRRSRPNFLSSVLIIDPFEPKIVISRERTDQKS